MIYLLDTDHLSLLQRGNAESLSLQLRLDRVPANDIATSIVTYEEQMRGWLARAAIRLANGATLLTRNLSDFRKVPNLRAEDWSV